MITAVLLVQLGSVTHAAWNLLATRVRGDGRLFVWACTVVSLVFLAPAAVVVAAANGARPSWALVGCSLLSGVFHNLYGISLQRAYATSDLNVAYPVARGVGPVLVVVVALLFLDEHLTWAGWTGVALIAVGVAVVSTGARAEPSTHERRVAGLRAGLVVAVWIAAYTLWDDQSVNRFDLDPVLYFCGTGVWQFALLTGLCWRRRAEAVVLAREHRGVVLAVALLSPVSYILVLAAMTMAPVSLVAPLRSTSIVIGSVAAWWLLKEPNGGRRLTGAALVMGGVLAMIAS